MIDDIKKLRSIGRGSRDTEYKAPLKIITNVGFRGTCTVCSDGTIRDFAMDSVSIICPLDSDEKTS